VLLAAVAAAQPAAQAQQAPATTSPVQSQVDGQVVGINSFAQPPIVQIASLEGVLTLRFRTHDHLAQSGLHYGDYVTATGRRLSAQELDVESVRVDSRMPVPQTTSDAADGSPAALPAASIWPPSHVS
jgi:hypothetical protein